jgi:hypothetical protein
MWSHEHDRAAMAALLDGLLAGASQLMESVGDWADRLVNDQPNELAAQFVNQLDDEWFDALAPDPLCEEITRQVRQRVSAWHPGWPHLWSHILRVTGTAVALAEEENADPVAAYLAGICHDVAKLDETRTGEPHEDVGAAFAARALRGTLSPAVIGAIQAAIRKEDDGALGEILHDADKLDKVGAAGVLRRVSTSTSPTWLMSALWRVGDDWQRFPSMHYDLSIDLAHSKSDFLAWFLPLAEDVAAGYGDGSP